MSPTKRRRLLDRSPSEDVAPSSPNSTSQDSRLAKRAPPVTWEQGRKFGIVIDAGSSGSRIQVYSWLQHDVARANLQADRKSLAVLPRIEKGVKEGDGWHEKANPGISTFGSNPGGVGPYLRPLLDHAMSIIPPSAVSSTPIYLLATAGMRLLDPQEREAVLSAACDFIKSNYRFVLPDCQSQIRVITGEEEGLYGWVAVNYLMDGFDAHEHGKAGRKASTYGFLDMGGASTQIAFEPTESERIKHADNLTTVRLALLDGRVVEHPVFVTTWLGYGTNQARERYIDREIDTFLRSHPAPEMDPEVPSSITSVDPKTASASDPAAAGLGSERPVTVIPDPCLPNNLLLSESRHTGYALQGTGSFTSCVARTAPLLNKDVPCPDSPCLFNGVHVPEIDFSVNHFIGISEYYYSTHDVFSLGGVYDFVEFERNAVDYCSRNWPDIVEDHRKTIAGESGSGGSKWAPGIEISRLEMQCFKAAWITNILHDGIGIPRIIDPGGKGTGINKTNEAMMKAGQKGLADGDPEWSGGRTPPPSFQSLNEVGDVAISWTLGKMVLEVSRDIPLATPNSAASGREKFPLFSDSAGHVPSWATGVGSRLSQTISNADPFIFIGLGVVGLFLWLFCGTGSGSRRKAFGGFFGKWTLSSTARSRQQYELVLDEMEAGEGLHSARVPNGARHGGAKSWKPSSGIVRKIGATLNWWANQLRTTVRPNSKSKSPYLPTTAVRIQEPASPNTGRPRSLRHMNSSPAIMHLSKASPSVFSGEGPTERGQTPREGIENISLTDTNGTIPSSRSQQIARAASAGMSLTPMSLTPPARPTSPGWPVLTRKASSRSPHPRSSSGSGSESRNGPDGGYLSVNLAPPTISASSSSVALATPPTNGHGNAWLGPEHDQSAIYFEPGEAEAGEEVAPGALSRTSSFLPGSRSSSQANLSAYFGRRKDTSSPAPMAGA